MSNVSLNQNPMSEIQDSSSIEEEKKTFNQFHRKGYFPDQLRSFKKTFTAKELLTRKDHFGDKVLNFRQNGEQYSFNKCEDKETSYEKQDKTECEMDEHEGDSSSMRYKDDLIKKYGSIYEELKQIDTVEIIYLLLEEIDQNDSNKEKLLKLERQINFSEDQVQELKSILEKKRQAIRLLCMTQTNNLNLIECLQMKVNSRQINLEGYYQEKYKQLSRYMNEYITSMNEAQEEFKKNYKLLKKENERLVKINEQSYSQKLQLKKISEILIHKQNKASKSVSLLKQKQATLNIKLENLEEENHMLKKEVNTLLQQLKSNQQFQIELARQNKELSSELDFIREKVNENQNMSRDIFQKMELTNDQYQKILKDNDKNLKELERCMIEKNQILKEKSDLMDDYQILCRQIEHLKQQNQKIKEQFEEKCNEISKLQLQITALNNYQEELLVEFQNEKESKEDIKSQLIALAEQVRQMQSTYRRQAVQNSKIKGELQRFWEQKDKSSDILSREYERLQNRNAVIQKQKGNSLKERMLKNVPSVSSLKQKCFSNQQGSENQYPLF